jgi:hypothetical protein
MDHGTCEEDQVKGVLTRDLQSYVWPTLNYEPGGWEREELILACAYRR